MAKAKKTTKKAPKTDNSARKIINVSLSERAAKKVARLPWGSRSKAISALIETYLGKAA